MKKNYTLYFCFFSFILLNIILLNSNLQAKRKLEKYFRLHIVANSNSIEDQITKLNVVKKVNNYLSSLYNNIKYSDLNQKDYFKYLIKDDINNILEVANNELANQQADYTCSANIGKIYYDEKKSPELNMNEGIYDSIQIVLGDGKGENFWSLIFPYSYNSYFPITNNNFVDDNIQVKSSIFETIQKVVKNFKS